MPVFKILGVVLMLAGFGTVLMAKNIVKRYNLDQKVEILFEHDMNEEEATQYKFSKAMVNVKLIGMLIDLPGIIITLIAFKR